MVAVVAVMVAVSVAVAMRCVAVPGVHRLLGRCGTRGKRQGGYHSENKRCSHIVLRGNLRKRTVCVPDIQRTLKVIVRSPSSAGQTVDAVWPRSTLTQ